MILVQLKGGLGNQMFQYAVARAMADRLETELAVDSRWFDEDTDTSRAFDGRRFDDDTSRAFGLDRFKVRMRLANKDDLAKFPERQRGWMSRLRNHWTSRRFYVERLYGYDPKWPYLGDDMYLIGYFQSEKYFSEMRTNLRTDFSPIGEVTIKNIDIASQIRNTESVAIHVRRGDYISHPSALQLHGVCSPEYYKAAVTYLQKSCSDARFFVFSNDMNWAKDNLCLGDHALFVEGNHDCPEMDIFLMAQCKHHIIANSSFSWWGAWLAGHRGQTVIAPDPWFEPPHLGSAHPIPDRWIRLRK